MQLKKRIYICKAHCVQSDITTMSVYGGIINFKHELSGQRIPIDRCLKHPNFSPAALNSTDLAVCRLNASFTLGRQVKAVILNEDVIGSGVSCQFMGWGAIEWVRIFFTVITERDMYILYNIVSTLIFCIEKIFRIHFYIRFFHQSMKPSHFQLI